MSFVLLPAAEGLWACWKLNKSTSLALSFLDWSSVAPPPFFFSSCSNCSNSDWSQKERAQQSHPTPSLLGRTTLKAQIPAASSGEEIAAGLGGAPSVPLLSEAEHRWTEQGHLHSHLLTPTGRDHTGLSCVRTVFGLTRRFRAAGLRMPYWAHTQTSKPQIS